MDTEQAYGTHFIVMEKLTGDLLEEAITRDNRWGGRAYVASYRGA